MHFAGTEFAVAEKEIGFVIACLESECWNTTGTVSGLRQKWSDTCFKRLRRVAGSIDLTARTFLTAAAKWKMQPQAKYGHTSR